MRVRSWSPGAAVGAGVTRSTPYRLKPYFHLAHCFPPRSHRASPSFSPERSRQAALVALHHPFPLNDIGVALGLPSRAALVVHWHSEIVRARPLAGLLAPLIRHTLARAQRIVVSHPALVSESPFLVAHSEKCVVIPYGIDMSYWTELDGTQRRRVDELRSRYPRLVMATGRLVPYKGFDVLIEALRRVEATAIVVGEGPLRNELLRKAQRRGVADRVILAGMLSRDDLKVHLHAAQLYAFPSVSAAEAFGIVQIEAMAVGLAIVNTDLPTGVPHVARHGLEALTVPPNEPEALAAAMAQLLADRELAQRLGAAGRRRARTDYDLEHFVKRVEEVYDQAVRAAGSTASESARTLGRFDDKPSLIAKFEGSTPAPNQLPAHAGDARTNQGLVAVEPEGEADQDRFEGSRRFCG